ncbi:hypothetical protein LCGC14_0265020 [marine sediment metagenome]|uniref:Uncharacterized protein n=1 Tax=marine sediment metagenome TaxID=412755 RepID=A0A0F9U5Q7_9ZZZZ
MNEEDRALREWIKTMPQEAPDTDTEFHRGVEDIDVRLIDWPANPYKAMFTIATSTWGGVYQTYKWAEAEPEARLFVVKAVLNRKSLPNAMEAPSFTFEIAGPSRSAFDQIARARIGAVFGSMGWRDNNHSNIGFRVPESIYQDGDRLIRFMQACKVAKDAYVDELATGQSNWQDARAVLPISACHRWSMGINYMALQNFMSKRLMFSEQADTVATAWLMRREIRIRFPLLASYLRPASDHARRCLEHGDQIGESFHNLFQCSGRWPCEQTGDKYTFNTACTDRETIMGQLGMHIPRGNEEMPDPEITLAQLDSSDRAYFLED